MSEKEAEIKYLTVKQFIAKQNGTWPSESALRSIILDESWGNKDFQGVFLRVGRRVLIDEKRFWESVRKMQVNNER